MEFPKRKQGQTDRLTRTLLGCQKISIGPPPREAEGLTSERQTDRQKHMLENYTPDRQDNVEQLGTEADSG